jgi:hypothetical protein
VEALFDKSSDAGEVAASIVADAGWSSEERNAALEWVLERSKTPATVAETDASKR